MAELDEIQSADIKGQSFEKWQSLRVEIQSADIEGLSLGQGIHLLHRAF